MLRLTNKRREEASVKRALTLENEIELIEGCRAGKDSARKELYTLYSKQMLAVCYRYTGDVDAAHDVLHDGFIKIFTHFTFRGECAFGLKQTERYIIRNHFETEKGIAIQGLLPTGDVTIVKCGGECLDEYYLSTGTLTENTNYINMCRTQVRIRMNTPADYFLKNPLGNHHIMIHGNYEEALNEFLLSNACKRTE